MPLRPVQVLDISLEEMVRNTLLSASENVAGNMEGNNSAAKSSWQFMQSAVNALLSENANDIACEFNSGLTVVFLGKKFTYIEELPTGSEFLIRIELGKTENGKDKQPILIHSSDVNW